MLARTIVEYLKSLKTYQVDTRINQGFARLYAPVESAKVLPLGFAFGEDL